MWPMPGAFKLQAFCCTTTWEFSCKDQALHWWNKLSFINFLPTVTNRIEALDRYICWSGQRLPFFCWTESFNTVLIQPVCRSPFRIRSVIPVFRGFAFQFLYGHKIGQHSFPLRTTALIHQQVLIAHACQTFCASHPSPGSTPFITRLEMAVASAWGLSTACNEKSLWLLPLNTAGSYLRPGKISIGKSDSSPSFGTKLGAFDPNASTNQSLIPLHVRCRLH